MIETLQTYIAERYSPLEVEFLDATKKFLSENLPRISEHVLSEWRKALDVASFHFSTRPSRQAKQRCRLIFMTRNGFTASLFRGAG